MPLNQFRRIWSDDGRHDRDFSEREERLKAALTHLKETAQELSIAAGRFLDVVNEKD